MKKAKIGAAAMALLLAAGLTACASDKPTTTPTDSPSQQQQQDNTPPVSEDPQAPQEQTPAEPEITVMDQPDEWTVAEDDKYVYTLAQLGGISGDGEFLIQVLHDFEPGETIDFRSMDLSQWEATGEEFLLTPGEGVNYFIRDGEAWSTGKLSDLRADDLVYLTQDAASGEVYAITQAMDQSEPTENDPVDATTGDAAVEDAADAASNANAADEGGTADDSADDAVGTDADASDATEDPSV